MDNWHVKFMGLAQHVAMWSKDPTAQVGAVVVAPNKRDMFIGYNGFPHGIEDTSNRLEDKFTKNVLTIHAELNAIIKATQSLEGWTLYSTRSPCIHCALTIIQAGIAEVITIPSQLGSSWLAEQLKAKTLFEEAKVNYRLIGDLKHETSSY